MGSGCRICVLILLAEGPYRALQPVLFNIGGNGPDEWLWARHHRMNMASYIENVANQDEITGNSNNLNPNHIKQSKRFCRLKHMAQKLFKLNCEIIYTQT